MNVEWSEETPRNMPQERWWEYLLFGILLVILGILAIIMPLFAAAVTVLALGIILVVGGIISVIKAFRMVGTGIFWVALMTGIIAFVVGALLIARPMLSILLITLLLSVYFFVSGLFRLIAGLAANIRPYSGWVAFGGFLSLVLGILLLSNWPNPALWLIGLLVGIDLIYAGLWAIAIGYGLHAIHGAINTRSSILSP